MSPNASSQPVSARRPENLALALQEVLTVCGRLRTGRQTVSDAGAFRHHTLESLKLAAQQARTSGYADEDVKMAVFAAVALVDESVLNLRHPVFADWPKRPLQEELFGHHIAGEVFYQNLQALAGRPDSQDLADLLEVYYLCLLLGFEGRYSLGARGELRTITMFAADRIRRIRGETGALSPAWGLPPEVPRVAGADPWVTRLGIAAAACLAFTLALFIIFKLTLGSGISTLADLAVR